MDVCGYFSCFQFLKLKFDQYTINSPFYSIQFNILKYAQNCASITTI